MIKDELKKRNIPDLMVMNNGEKVTKENWGERRKELLECLCENLYGYSPEAPKEVKAIFKGNGERNQHFGGKAVTEEYDLLFETPNGEYSFPIVMHIPTKVKNPPVIVCLSFKRESPNIYMPTEEIIDNGFAIVYAVYTDITPDTVKGDFKDGLAGKYIGDRQREKTECGLVGFWAYGASRIMDYLVTRRDLNTKRIAITGHSRIGKTALWTKALDDRFFMAHSNDGNYGGAGLIRGHIGEDVKDFFVIGSYNFFCEKFKDYLDVPHDELPYEMHYLLACQAPSPVHISGATLDRGMDPLSEFLSCVATSEVYEMLGENGFVTEDEEPEVGKEYNEGNIGMYIREGSHFFGREDWQSFMTFFKKYL